MNKRLTAIVEREGDGYVAFCPEVDVASQGESLTEARDNRDNLAEALTLFSRPRQQRKLTDAFTTKSM